MPKLGDDEAVAARLPAGARLVVERQPLKQATATPVSDREPSGALRRRHQKRLREYADLLLRALQAFLGVAPVRQSAETSSSFSAPRSSERHVQHWDVDGQQGGYCQVDGGAGLTFPLVSFQPHHDRVLLTFTVPYDQVREANRWSLSLEGSAIIFGEVLELRQWQDDLAFTVLLHPEASEVKAQAGGGVRYHLAVPTGRYRHELAAYERRLERAGLLLERLKALEQLRQERSRLTVKQPARCQGCRHRHGRSYGGTLLVCGMHPYGNGEGCSDFEAQ
ncbi:hypothetical protein H6F86_25780 [Phormidium sp. FACHB-592]|uniref:Uncharacterized protein n=1 Tax=Stenomitos frigidus AS-A4 TaxID=2933935 RepID=A0ABV0KTI4_9CYAN|nr:hypothetical protein [Phormidium sp. FACHB-592]MBD2077226.1 hypothetical protein [Phormidium sp. FACHB-592]